ncbi:hypothetical protein MICRO8M_80470 [Microbacterium sp. 8M]|nr:hypothetical protein MICRO8M_80470 [Microbacterium sp. 8M]
MGTRERGGMGGEHGDRRDRHHAGARPRRVPCDHRGLRGGLGRVCGARHPGRQPRLRLRGASGTAHGALDHQGRPRLRVRGGGVCARQGRPGRAHGGAVGGVPRLPVGAQQGLCEPGAPGGHPARGSHQASPFVVGDHGRADALLTGARRAWAFGATVARPSAPDRLS